MNFIRKLFNKDSKFVTTVKILIIIFLLIVSLVNGDVDTVLQVVTSMLLGA
jgi:hypothetical protein